MQYKNIIIDDRLKKISYPAGPKIKETIKVGKIMAKVLAKVYPGQSLRLICSGSSGAIHAAVISTNRCVKVMEIIHIKKDGEYANNNSHEVGSQSIGKCINVIVDDFICSGGTVERIWKKFHEANNRTEMISGVIVCGGVNENVAESIIVDNLMCGCK